MSLLVDSNRSSIMFLAVVAIPTFILFAFLNTCEANQLSPAFIPNTSTVDRLSFARNNVCQPFMYIKNGRRSRHILSSTMERGRDTDQRAQEDKISYNVIYQKVLRAPSNQQANTFLIELITYLQSMYELPTNLAMPYESEVPENENEHVSQNRAILVIDSPLADDPSQARIEVEVIGIFPDSDDDNSKEPSVSGPTMAMVALKKIKSKNNNGNEVTAGLFADCEKRIVQSFDRGLQDLEEGRVDTSSLITDETATPSSRQDEFNDMDDDGIDAAIKRMGYQNAINAAAPSDADISSKDRSDNSEVNEPKNPITIERDLVGNVIIDSNPATPKLKQQQSPTVKSVATAKVSSKVSPASSAAAVTKSVQTNESADIKTKSPKDTDDKSYKKFISKQSTKGSESEDFAVLTARKRAEALMKTAKLDESLPFTISGGEGDFAVEMARKRAAARKASTKSISKSSSKGQEPGKAKPTPAIQKKKHKAQDLSKDPMFMKLQSIANKSKQQFWTKTISKKGSRSLESDDDVVKISANEPAIESVEEQPTNKKIGAAVPASVNVTPQKTDDEIRSDITKIAKENEEVQDLLRSATDMLPDDGDEELSPEELLERILKFGDEKEKEEKPGVGFVEGAMSKAKDLLQSEQREQTNNRDFGYKEIDRDEEMKRKAEEDELKKIFAAGQNTAQGKLSKPQSNHAEMIKAPMTEEELDALIAADDTVPLNARKLDEEFAELEVRVARSIGEENDGPAQNKMFDVFSGPEVYNPNVDPATAVNWPGAKADTRTDVKLAKELEEALKQAKFAAAVLLNMREEAGDNGIRYVVGDKEISSDRIALLRKCVKQAVKAGIIENPEIRLTERSRLQMLIDELASQPEERFEEIALNYKDLLLSDNFIDLVRERMYAMAKRDLKARAQGNEDLHKESHARERAIMMNLVQLAQGLIKEAQALGAELEVSMLEIIRSICEVAMDPSHTTEQETAVALTDAVRDMRPLLDDVFVAYLKYAIAEEEAKLERQGVVDDPEYNRWLFVLKIVQEGVYAELSRGVKRYIDHIGYVLRMKTKAERRDLLSKLIEVMPTMDVRPFVKVVGNIVSSLGTSVKGDFADGIVLGEMTNKLLQLQRDVEDLLPPDKINEMSKEADGWAAKQRERLLERQKVTRQRLIAARETGSIDADEVLTSGEYDRFD